MISITRILLIIGVFTTLFSFSSEATKKSWKLEKNKNGIKVYTYVPKGKSLKQIKTFTIVDAKISSVLSVLADVPHYSDWIYNCSEANVIKKINTHEMVYYTVSNSPWPVEDRDMIIHNKVHQNKKTKVFTSVSINEPNTVPEKKGMQRIPRMYSKWTIKPLKNGKLAIEYFLDLDPGGKVPNWVTNMFISMGPYQSILNFKTQLELKRHKNANYDFIVNN